MLTYQFYYMIAEQCAIDTMLSDFIVYCWNDGLNIN